METYFQKTLRNNCLFQKSVVYLYKLYNMTDLDFFLDDLILKVEDEKTYNSFLQLKNELEYLEIEQELVDSPEYQLLF